MKWKKAQANDERIRRVFLFCPRSNDKERRWLEFATIKERFVVGDWDGIKYWQFVDFVDEEKS